MNKDKSFKTRSREEKRREQLYPGWQISTDKFILIHSVLVIRRVLKSYLSPLYLQRTYFRPARSKYMIWISGTMCLIHTKHDRSTSSLSSQVTPGRFGQMRSDSIMLLHLQSLVQKSLILVHSHEMTDSRRPLRIVYLAGGHVRDRAMGLDGLQLVQTPVKLLQGLQGHPEKCLICQEKRSNEDDNY